MIVEDGLEGRRSNALGLRLGLRGAATRSEIWL